MERNNNFNQNKFGKKDASKKGGFADTVGNAIEDVGDRLSKAGATKVGKVVHDLGHKIETSHTDSSKKWEERDREEKFNRDVKTPGDMNRNAKK